MPGTPAGIQAMFVHYGIDIAGKHVVIVGRGPTLGRPLSLLLTLKQPGANAAVTVVHTGVPDMAAYTREADVVVAAVGVAVDRHPRHGAARAPSWSAAASAGRAASCCPTSTRRSARSPRGSPPGSAGWGRPRSPCSCATRWRRPNAGRRGNLGNARADMGGAGCTRPDDDTSRRDLADVDASRSEPMTAAPPGQKIPDLLAAGPTLSFEFFPPKTDEAERQLEKAIHELAPLRPVVRVGDLRRRRLDPRAHPRHRGRRSTARRRSRRWPT